MSQGKKKSIQVQQMDRIPVHTSSCAPPVEGRARATTREEDELGGGEPRTGARESSRRPDTGEDGILSEKEFLKTLIMMF